MTDEQKPETVAEPTVIILSNGTRKDPKTGYFLSGPDKAHQPITKANAKEMSRRGAEARIRKARQEIIRAAEEHTGREGLRTSDAYAVIAGEAVRSGLANMMDKPRDAVPAVKLGLQMGKIAPTEEEHKGPVTDGLAVTGAGLDFLRSLLQRSAPQLLPTVIEGEARELEE